MSVYGWLIEFDDPERLIRAAETARAAGFRHLDAHTPFPVEELPEALGFKKNRVPLCALLGGISGGIGGFFMQWYANVWDYPINVAGRPNDSWPAFVPVTFELTVLFASFGAALGWLFLCRLPEVWHPVFSVPDFVRATQDRFFLCVRNQTPSLATERVQAILQAHTPLRVIEVPEVPDED